ncbi:protein Exd1 homolog [Drosophila willistoni]|uniref:protein Exd1 homolog n=1 Tax=Drosophila willistoni TaxID=7260 RepID=UPI000C26D98A|nr:protein Exd1 homolog [Drosophila willistoni]
MDDTDSECSFHSANEDPPEWTLLQYPLLPQELNLLNRQLEKIVYIYQADAAYHKALKDISNETRISIVMEPSFYGRHRAASVLTIATDQQAYVFDILSLGAIFPDLAHILTADSPKKVVHYGHRIADQLYYRHSLELNGTTDTFVATCLARQDNKPCTLAEAISMVFELPLNELLCEELLGTTLSRQDFTGRPLSSGQVIYLAKMAILQSKLLDRLMNDKMATSIQQISKVFSKQFRDNPISSEVALGMAPLSRYGFHCIDQQYNSC